MPRHQKKLFQHSGDDILNKLGVTDSAGSFSDVLQTAQSAEFTLDGIFDDRDTNDISDVLTGVTLRLLQTTSERHFGEHLGSGRHQPDFLGADDLRHQLQCFRDAVDRPADHQCRRHGSSSSVLFGDSTMRDIMTRVSGGVRHLGGGLTMSDLGLSFNRRRTSSSVDTHAVFGAD